MNLLCFIVSEVLAVVVKETEIVSHNFTLKFWILFCEGVEGEWNIFSILLPRDCTKTSKQSPGYHPVGTRSLWMRKGSHEVLSPDDLGKVYQEKSRVSCFQVQLCQHQPSIGMYLSQTHRKESVQTRVRKWSLQAQTWLSLMCMFISIPFQKYTHSNLDYML